jgi:hypothetical protein
MEQLVDGGHGMNSLGRTGNIVLDLLYLAFGRCVFQGLSDFDDLHNEARVIQLVCF